MIFYSSSEASMWRIFCIWYGSVLPRNLPSSFLYAVMSVVYEWSGMANDDSSLITDPYALQILGAVLGWILVQRSTFAYNRWWEARSAIETMQARWAHAAMHITHFELPSKLDDGAYFRARVVHLFSLLHAVSMADLRMDWRFVEPTQTILSACPYGLSYEPTGELREAKRPPAAHKPAGALQGGLKASGARAPHGGGGGPRSILRVCAGSADGDSRDSSSNLSCEPSLRRGEEVAPRGRSAVPAELPYPSCATSRSGRGIHFSAETHGGERAPAAGCDRGGAAAAAHASAQPARCPRGSATAPWLASSRPSDGGGEQQRDPGEDASPAARAEGAESGALDAPVTPRDLVLESAPAGAPMFRLSGGSSSLDEPRAALSGDPGGPPILSADSFASDMPALPDTPKHRSVLERPIARDRRRTSGVPSTSMREAQEESGLSPLRFALTAMFYVWDPHAFREQALSNSFHVIGGLSRPERRALASTHSRDRPFLVQSWIIALMVERVEQGGLPVGVPIISGTYQLIGHGHNSFCHAAKIATTPFPFPYVQLISLLLHVFNLLTPLFVAGMINRLDGQGRVAMLVIFLMTFFVTLGYSSLNQVARELEEPYGHGPNHLPLNMLHRGWNERMVHLLLYDAQRGVPEDTLLGSGLGALSEDEKQRRRASFGQATARVLARGTFNTVELSKLQKDQNLQSAQKSGLMPSRNRTFVKTT